MEANGSSTMVIDFSPFMLYNEILQKAIADEYLSQIQLWSVCFFSANELEDIDEEEIYLKLSTNVRNTRTVNRTAQLTGYKLAPGSNCLPVTGSESKFIRRAVFLKHNLWVTRYAPDEMFLEENFLIKIHVPAKDWLHGLSRIVL